MSKQDDLILISRIDKCISKNPKMKVMFKFDYNEVCSIDYFYKQIIDDFLSCLSSKVNHVTECEQFLLKVSKYVSRDKILKYAIEKRIVFYLYSDGVNVNVVFHYYRLCDIFKETVVLTEYLKQVKIMYEGSEDNLNIINVYNKLLTHQITVFMLNNLFNVDLTNIILQYYAFNAYNVTLEDYDEHINRWIDRSGYDSD